MHIYALLFLFFSNLTFASIDTIWFNAHVLTMNDSFPEAEAVAVSNGRIVEIGKNENILKMREFRTKLIDLGGKSLLPGFIDTYGSLTGTAIKKISAPILPPPHGKTTSIADMKKELSQFLKSSNFPKDYGVLIGFGYDDSKLLENRSPTKSELDQISERIPILVVHQSDQRGVMNTKALSLVGMTTLKDKASKGEIEGKLFAESLFKLFSNLSDRQIIDILLRGEEEYLQNGFTTIQDEGSSKEQIEILIKASKEKKLTLDVVSFLDYTQSELDAFLDFPYFENTNSNPMYTYHFRIGGKKIHLDGTLQSKTAWLSSPYFKRPLNKPKGYNGNAKLDDTELEKIYKEGLQNNTQILSIANGDQAIDQLINTYKRLKIKYPNSETRPFLIHGHTIRKDQIHALKDLGIGISFYPEFIYDWGDFSVSNILGKKRAEKIDPASWAEQFLTRFTLHNNAPELSPNALKMIDSAVKRETKKGKVLGEELKISTEMALKAITDWASYQYFEEKSKGTLEKGKIADFVILSGNPLKNQKVKVLETIKEGESVYRHPSFKIKNRHYNFK